MFDDDASFSFTKDRMNIQEQITNQETQLAALRSLRIKKFSQWTEEETLNFENKHSLDIEIISVQLAVIELFLKKPFDKWTAEEKEEHVDKDHLREKEKELLEKEKELRKEKAYLLEKEKDLRRLLQVKATPTNPQKNLKPNDSAVELSSIAPEVQSTIWKSVVRITCQDEFSGSGLIIDKYDNDVKGLGPTYANSLYILTNLHLLGKEKHVMESISPDFQKQIKKLGKLGKFHGESRSKKQKLDSQDPLKVQVEQFRDGKLVNALEFTLSNDVCWEAYSNLDMMILKVPIPKDCSLEKCNYTQYYVDTMPVHIFGFPGSLVADASFQHDYAIIPAQITGRDPVGRLLLSTLSAPGLSGSAIVCTARGEAIGYLGGGFDTGRGNQQYQSYGFGFIGLPQTMPRFLATRVARVKTFS